MAVHPLATAEALDGIVGLLDRVEPDRSQLVPAERLALVESARRVAGRVEALLCTLVAEADAADASLRAKATPLTTWLTTTAPVTRAEAAGLMRKARAVADHEQVRVAAGSGQIGIAQARAIADVLDGLPGGLDDEQKDRAETLLVELAGRLDADGLAKSASRVLAEVAPETEAEETAQRLQREAEAARRKRSLRFYPDGPGSTGFRGSLPTPDAEAWKALLGAYRESTKRTLVEARDPLAGTIEPEQRMADALMAMVHDHQVGAQAPSVGGDRPRVVVTLNLADLERRAIEAGVLEDGVALSAGDLRRLCCDSDLLPAVLGGPSEVLDVGRSRRLVTPEIRRALVLRDGGCAFPGCVTVPTSCEAHHIVPWWRGGVTSLANLVLLCPHHHGVVEPAKFGLRDQWQVQLARDGTPEFIPPRRVDAERRPVRHQRFLLREQLAQSA